MTGRAGGMWTFRGDRVRTIDNPLHLARLKAKELKEQLRWADRELGIRAPVPFIQEVVFLSAPDLRCEFDDGLREGPGPRPPRAVSRL